MKNKRNSLLIKKKYMEYLIPTVFTTMAISLASVVDGIIVGNLLASDALAAVGLAGPIILATNGLFYLFSVGGVNCASMARGEQDSKRADILFTLCQGLGVLAMLAFAVLATVFSQPLAMLLTQGDEALAELTGSYISSVVWAGPFLSFALVSAQFWKLDGRPKAATQISIIANIVNLVFDYVLIRFFNMGIAGAGISTAIGYFVGTLFSLRYYLDKKRTFHFSLPRKGVLAHISSIVDRGAYKMFASLSLVVQNLLLNYLVVMTFGALGMACMTVCINVLMISNIFINGTSETLLPIVSTLYGEKDIMGIRAAFKKAAGILLGISLTLTAGFIIFSQGIGALFGLADAQSLAVLNPALRLYSLSLPMYAMNQMLAVLYSSTGHSKRANTMSLLEWLVFINGFALLFTFVINSDLLWLCYAAGSGTVLVIMLISSRFTLKRHKELEGVALLPHNTEFVKWERTIVADEDMATGLSQDMLDFCKQNNVPASISNRMAVSIEEMIVNTAQFNRGAKPVTVDVMLSVSEEEVLLRFRDDGAPFNPNKLALDDELLRERIHMASSMSKAISYTYQLGFNTDVLSFARPCE